MLRTALFTGLAAGLLAPLAAHAQQPVDTPAPIQIQAYDTADLNQWYLAAGVGMIFPEDTEITRLNTGAVAANDISLDTGYSLSLAVGLYLNRSLRAEVEVAYRETDLDQVTTLGTTTDLPGKVRAASAMANLYYDLPITDGLDFYVGGGVGVTYVESSGVDGFLIFRDADDWVLSGQLMAGLTFHLTDQLALTGGYRLFITEDYDFSGTEYDAPLIHSVEVGVRFSF